VVQRALVNRKISTADGFGLEKISYLKPALLVRHDLGLASNII
jgi:hypothetical protein